MLVSNGGWLKQKRIPEFTINRGKEGDSSVSEVLATQA